MIVGERAFFIIIIIVIIIIITSWIPALPHATYSKQNHTCSLIYVSDWEGA